MEMFSHDTTDGSDQDDKLQPSNIEDTEAATNLTGECSHLINKSSCRFLYTSLSISSSDGSPESESSSEFDMPDFDFSNSCESATFTQSLRMRPSSPEPPHSDSELSDIADSETASSPSSESAFIPNKSTCRVLYTSLSSSSDGSSISSSESVISDSYFSNHCATTDPVSASIGQNCRLSGSETSNDKLKPNTSTDTETASILLHKCSHIHSPHKSNTSLSCPISSGRTELKHSSRASESDSEFHSNTFNEVIETTKGTYNSDKAYEKFAETHNWVQSLNILNYESTWNDNHVRDCDSDFLEVDLENFVLGSEQGQKKYWKMVESEHSRTSESNSEFYSNTLNEIIETTRGTYNSDKAYEKFADTHNWVQSLNILNFESTWNDNHVRDCDSDFLEVDLENSVSRPKQRHKKFWKKFILNHLKKKTLMIECVKQRLHQMMLLGQFIHINKIPRNFCQILLHWIKFAFRCVLAGLVCLWFLSLQ